MRVLLFLTTCLLTGCTYPPLGMPRELGRVGISAIVPYDGGFLVSDARYFEGSVGLWFVSDGEARDLPGCSAGTPRLVDEWVWWITARCTASPDLRRARIHRARPDGSCHHVRLLRSTDGNALFEAARILDRLAPGVRSRARPLRTIATNRMRPASGECAGRNRSCDDGPGRRLHGVPPGPSRHAAAHGVPAQR